MSDKTITVPRADIKAHVLGGRTSGVLKALGVSNIKDPFAGAYGSKGGNTVLKPPFEPLHCALFAENSDILPQCVEAMAVNIHSFGFDFVPYPANEDKSSIPEAQDEYQSLMALFGYPNPDGDFRGLSMELRYDLEYTGNAYIEVVRNVAGDIQELYHLPSVYMRLTAQDKELTEYNEMIRDLQGNIIPIPRRRYFRRYVQKQDDGTKTYFKEFGDPRTVDMTNGTANKEVAPENIASEVIHLKLWCGYSPYGMPRWVGSINDMIGSTKVQEINVDFFDNKAVPPMAILVSGGQLSEGSERVIEDIINNEIKGSANFHKILILQAVPMSTGTIEGEKLSNVRIDFKILRSAAPNDGQFMKYQDNNRLSVMSDFRLPPITVGRSKDYNNATSKMAMLVAENQVFEPARRTFASIINRKILASMGINHWSFVLLAGAIQDNAEILKALSTVQEKLPSRMIINQASEAASIPIPDMSAIPEELLNIPAGLLQYWDGISTEAQKAYPDTVKNLINELREKREQIENAIAERMPELVVRT